MEENRGTPENKQMLEMIPFSVHEAAMDQAERHAKRWMTFSFILLGVIFAITLKVLV
jgi:hypothetical protein